MTRYSLQDIVEQIDYNVHFSLCVYCNKTQRCGLYYELSIFCLKSEDKEVTVRHHITRCKYFERDVQYMQWEDIGFKEEVYYENILRGGK